MSDPRKSLALSDIRKKELLNHVEFILCDLVEDQDFGSPIKGPKSMAQEIVNRIESITKKTDEFKFLVDVVAFLIDKSKGAEVQVVYKGRILSKEDLARDHGIIVAPKKTFLNKT